MAEKDNQIPADKPKAAAKKPLDNVPQGEKMLSMLGYISFFCILPLALKPSSAFCQHHGKQALVLTLLFWVMGIFELVPALAVMIGIIQIIVIIFCMMRAYKGSQFKLPFVSLFAEKLNW